MSENRKIVVWFLAAFLIALYAKWAHLIPPMNSSPNTSGNVLGQSASTSAGFGPLLHRSK